MSVTQGFLHAALAANGTVRTWFATESAKELRPLLTKNMDTAEEDFIRSYGLTPYEAAAFRELIERHGSASVPVALAL